MSGAIDCDRRPLRPRANKCAPRKEGGAFLRRAARQSTRTASWNLRSSRGVCCACPTLRTQALTFRGPRVAAVWGTLLGGGVLLYLYSADNPRVQQFRHRAAGGGVSSAGGGGGGGT